MKTQTPGPSNRIRIRLPILKQFLQRTSEHRFSERTLRFNSPPKHPKTVDRLHVQRRAGPFHCGPLYDRDFLQRCLQAPVTAARGAFYGAVGRLPPAVVVQLLSLSHCSGIGICPNSILFRGTRHSSLKLETVDAFVSSASQHLLDDTYQSCQFVADENWWVGRLEHLALLTHYLNGL